MNTTKSADFDARRAALRKEHTAVYDSSMSDRPRSHYCRRCSAYVSRTHVEDMREIPPTENGRAS